MTPERWRKIETIFNLVVDAEPAAQAALLDQHCNSDEALRREIEALLGATAADDFLRNPINEAAQSLPQPKEADLTGERLGAYQLTEQIGKGGMGVVYRALDTRLGRTVALKLLPAAFVNDDARLRRFRQEARAISALNHPNILTIHEIGEAETTSGTAHFIATEFVEGRTLRAAMKENALTLGGALDVLTQAAAALSAAHEAGVIHRDLKPENLMLRPDGVVKVLDFGLAKFTVSQARQVFSTVHTDPGLVMGTVNYMSPEQARGLEVDARSDIFSLGVVAYEMLTGRAPFAGATTSDTLVAILEREPAPLKQIAPALPAELLTLVSRALAKDAAQRHQHVNELHDALKDLKQELELAARLKRSGDGPQQKVSLHLRVGETAPDAVIDTADKPTAVTNAITKPAALRRFMTPITVVAALLTAALSLLLAGGLASRFWWQPSQASFHSVAVLPFSNAGNEPQMEFLPEALTENLIDSLTRLPSLRVSAYNTVNSYQGRAADPRQIGKELQVAAIITGRIVGQGERMTARVELIDTTDGARLWGEDFLLPRDNLLTAQTEIAREIAAKLRLRLSPENERQLAKRHTADRKAYELYAQGRSLYLRYNRASQEKALEAYRQAILLDPNYALAYCGIADVYADFSSQYMPPSEAMPKAREAALKALELDETLPEAHHSLALIKWWGDWDWAGAEREIKRALELNPNLVNTRIYYAEFLSCQKRFEEALREIKRAEDYDPASLRAIGWEAGINIRMRQYERAREIYRTVYTNASGAQRQTAVILSYQGAHQEALALWQKIYTPDQPLNRLAWLGYFYAKAGQRNEALKVLRELEARAKREDIRPHSFVLIYLGLGDHEKAIALLQKSYAERQEYLKNLVDPVYDSIRNDPRFIEILRGVGLPQ